MIHTSANHFLAHVLPQGFLGRSQAKETPACLIQLCSPQAPPDYDHESVWQSSETAGRGRNYRQTWLWPCKTHLLGFLFQLLQVLMTPSGRNHCFEQVWSRAEQQMLQHQVPVLPTTIPVWEALCVHLPFLLNLHCLPSIQHQPITKTTLGWWWQGNLSSGLIYISIYPWLRKSSCPMLRVTKKITYKLLLWEFN